MLNKELTGRRHGDGSLKLELSLETDEQKSYLEVLKRILLAVDLDFDLNQTNEVSQVLLAVKQRLALGFSNGCPHPEKATIDFLNKEKVRPTNFKQLSELILESGRGDAQCNVLYQKILQYANQTLRSELQLLKPAETIDGQENENLPKERTEHNLVAGMASDPVFFNILVPLRDFIIGSKDQQSAYNQVLKFLIKAASESTNIKELIEKSSNFSSS